MKDGKEVWATLEGFGSLSRKIPGTVAELRSFTEAELIAFKKEYARQRVLRAWLADSDGHMGNQVVCEDGRLRAIDFGLGTVRDGSGESLRQFGIIRAGDDVDYMRQALNLSSDPGFQTLDQEGKYLWINRADEILDYDADMAPTVQMIVEMCNDRGPTGLASIVRERLRAPDGVVNENEVQAVMGVLRKRAENLETVLKERLDRVVADAVKKQAMLWDRLPAHRPLAVARPQPAVPRPLFAPSPRPGEALAASLRQPLAA
jgi:hypothetical protein